MVAKRFNSLTVGLPWGHVWNSAGNSTRNGIFYNLWRFYAPHLRRPIPYGLSTTT